MEKNSKKVIILWHNGGRMANQLWLFISVYAYALEKGYRLENHCFFEYSQYFNFGSGNKLIDLVFYKGFAFLKNNLKGIWKDPYHQFFRRFYKLYLELLEAIYRNQIVFVPDSATPVIHYLPPSLGADEKIKQFDAGTQSTIYLDGWLFRNPAGLAKYHREIAAYFRPQDSIQKRVNGFITSLRSHYSHLVGVHIRQGDYKTWQGGKYYFIPAEVSMFLRQYLEVYKKNSGKTCFIVCSDGQVDMGDFKGLNVVKSIYGAIEDLFILAQTDIIIGSSSTFGAFAAYYGKKQFITFRRPNIDLQYYLSVSPNYEGKYYSINSLIES